MMLNQLQESLPVNLPCRAGPNQVAILRPLRPADAEQQQIELRRPVRLVSRDLIRRILPLLLQVAGLRDVSLKRYIRAIDPRLGVAKGSKNLKYRDFSWVRFPEAIYPCIVQKGRISRRLPEPWRRL